MNMSIPKDYKQREDLLTSLAQQIRMLVFDFDGVFTNNRVLVMQDGTEGVFCYRSDGFGIASVKALGIEVMVLSTEINPVVSKRCEKLGLPYVQGCSDKSRVLEQEATKRKISLQDIAYMGNDTNDLDCLRLVGLPACVSDAHPEVLAVSLYITKTRGGYGAVREFCDFIVSEKTKKVSFTKEGVNESPAKRKCD